MIQSYDVGSMPFQNNLDKYLEGANGFKLELSESFATYFERKVFEAFIDKLNAGIDIPNFPQFRDMNNMFLSMIDGIEKVEKTSYVITGDLRLKTGKGVLPEVAVIQKNSKEIYSRLGNPFKLKVCATGPYTLASLFHYKTSETFQRLGDVLAQIVRANIFNNKHNRVVLVSLDEPAFGLLDDPLIDVGSHGRESLLKAWETIFHAAKARAAQTCIHLHSTADQLFWEIASLDIVESHTNDSLYQMDSTKKLLEEKDKFLKASLCVTNFDQLIENNILADSEMKLGDFTLDEKVAEFWKLIQNGKLNPTMFLEDVKIMEKRLENIVKRFGVERVPYAGPECGLKGFPTYVCALEYLRRVSMVIKRRRE